MLKTTASLLALLLAAPAAALAQSAAPSAQGPSAAQSEDARLAAFFDKAFKEQAALSPESQTRLGLKTHYGELDDYTDAANRKRLDLAEAQLAQMLRDFDFGKLSHASQLSYRLFEDQVKTGRVFYKYRWHNFTISTEGSVAGRIPVLLLNSHRVDSVSDAEAYVSRLNAVERVMNESADDLLDRAGRGFIAPAFAFDPVMEDARRVITGAPYDSGPDTAVWADFKKKVAALKTDDATRTRLLSEGEAALKGPFKRGYERFIAAVGEVKPKATSTDGVWRLPDGDAYYAAAVKFFTTTDLTPEQIHQTGLSEVARIHGEMERIKDKVGFHGTLRAFLDHVKTAPEFHYPNTPQGKQQFLDDAKAIVASYMKNGAPQQFSRLPRSPLEVKAVETFREKTAPVAFYNQGTPDGSRPGIYYVNLSDMTQVSKPQIEATTCHEGAPGHHFQIARALEQQDLPMFRRFAFYGAYAEGWGLYAERLCKEAGGYADPYAELGALSLEVWRAARLVVDTGIHYKRWSREKAMAYFHENTMLSDRDVQKEVDRYIANPGQATSYKIGQLRILQLRDKARAALGPKFDIRDFHEVVLRDGALPLDVLEAQVDAYIAAREAG